ncbi:ATP-binding protein [Cellulomonas hominis]
MTSTDGYRRRIVDDQLDFLVANLFAIAIDGPKAVGKTATAEQRAATVHRLDTDPIDLIEADPSRLTAAPEPILIDEWQHWPRSWDLVRRSVDDDPRPGRFLLTGSASLRNPQTHSGAGRIVSLRMRPLTLPERGEVAPEVSLADLLSGQAGTITGESEYRLEDYTEQIVGGGFPGMQSLGPAARAVQLDGYIRRIVERDFPEAGKEVRNPAGLLRWMRAFAAATSTTATFETIRDAAATGHTNPPPRSSTIPYRDTLESIWISDPVPAWHPVGVRIDRLTEGPKHHLADPALAAALLGASVQDLLTGRPLGPAVPRDGHLLGALFESLVALDVRVFAQAADAEVHHLRTKNSDHEVDLIVTGRGERSCIGIEVKVSPTVTPDDVRHLHWLKSQMGDQLTDMVLVNTGRHAYRRPDGIAVIPLALLGP